MVNYAKGDFLKTKLYANKHKTSLLSANMILHSILLSWPIFFCISLQPMVTTITTNSSHFMTTDGFKWHKDETLFQIM